MGMIIVPGNNNGYPYAEGLPPNIGRAVLVPPYPDFIMRCRGNSVNNGYPSVEGLPPNVSSADLEPPYPDFIMLCLGSSFNNGYPLIMKLHNIRRTVFSDLAFADMHAEEINFGGRTVYEAFCKGQKVYGTVYTN